MAQIQSKKKGNRAELEIVKILKNRFPEYEFRRSPGSGAYVGGSNREISEGLDYETKLVLASDILVPKNFKFIIESKFYAEASFWDLFNTSSDLKRWFKQVEGDAEFVNKLPMLVVKYNRKPRIVYINKKLKGYIFETDGWYCYYFEDILNKKNNFFFEG